MIPATTRYVQGGMALLVHRFAWPYLLSQVVTTGVVLGWNFTVNSLWSFGSGSSALSGGGKCG